MNVNWFSAFVTVLFALRSNVLALGLDLSQKAAIQLKFLASGIACTPQNPLSLSDIQDMQNKTLPNKKNTKCFIQCLFMDLGIMDDKGKLSAAKAKESAMEIFPNDQTRVSNVEKLVNTCSPSVNMLRIDEEGKKNCDVATHAFKCLTLNAPQFEFETVY